MEIIVTNNEATKKGIIAIGQSLIERAEEISRDLERVNFDITKNYTAEFKEENKK